MKIRNGFVSNSSSSSFILISKEKDIPNSSHCGKTFKNRLGDETPDYERFDVDATDKASYRRCDIMLLTSMEDKIRYLTHLYACWYQNETE